MKPPPLPPHPMDPSLAGRLAVWRRGLFVAAALRVGAWLLVALAGVAGFGYFLPLPSAVRLGFAIGLPAVTLAVLVWKALDVRRVGPREMAILADTLRQNPRRSLLGAYELLRADRQPPGILANKTVADAQLGFHDLPPARCRPHQMLRAAKVAAGTALGIILFLVLLNPGAVPTLVARLVSPAADIPPYSPLEFEITPANPEVVYGEDIELSVVVRGGAVNGPVRLLTRHEGHIEHTDCFRGNNNLHRQKLENVIRPVEFCFATGKARSRWHTVRVLLEPRFALVKATITPPTYTREAAKDIVLGRDDIRAVQGSTATLTVTSNRPLSGGRLRMKPLDATVAESDVEATPVGPHTVQFQWPMRGDAQLEVQIRDVQGTPAAEPLAVRQIVVPDEKPRLALHEPAAHSLATPRSIIPVHGTAEDDFGLKRIDFVRTLEGFRERPKALPVPAGDKKYDFQARLDLGALGVKPGQVLEFYAEGRDENPTLMGIQTSEVARVKIISEAEYAEMLRNRIPLDELLARFDKIREQLDRVREAVRQARDNPAQLKDAAQMAREAAETLESLAADFPAFDVEKAMQPALAESATRARNAADRLAALHPNQPDLSRQMSSILGQFEGGQTDLAEMLGQQVELESVGRLMELAADFMQLVKEQDRVARWIDRMAASPTPDTEALAAATHYQEELREAADRLPGQIRRAAEAIPDEIGYGQLKADAAEFANRMAATGANDSMSAAASSALNHNAPRSAQAARRAHGQLQALLPPPGSPPPDQNAFGGMCRGRFLPGESPMGRTLAQRLAGLLGCGHQKTGSGAGDPADDGYAVAGIAPLDLPVFGPQRTRLQAPPRPSLTSFGSLRENAAAAPKPQRDDPLRVNQPAPDTPGGTSISLQNIPEKYRDAVRKYFTP